MDDNQKEHPMQEFWRSMKDARPAPDGSHLPPSLPKTKLIGLLGAIPPPVLVLLFLVAVGFLVAFLALIAVASHP